jgi:thiol-disulfide isomerase/thioredoxin
MKKIITAIALTAILFSCKNDGTKGKFTITGDIKNLPNQKIFLEELFFSDRNPEVLDTADVKNGKFELAATAPAQGIYRMRLEKEKTVFVLINDKSEISLQADYSNLSMKTITVNTPANGLLKNFILTTDEQRTALQNKDAELQQLNTANKNDSSYLAIEKAYVESSIIYKEYLVNFIDTSSNAVVALFALGYTRGIEPEKLEKPIAGLTKRFPDNETVASIVQQYKQKMAQAAQKQAAEKTKLQIGSIAPDLSMETPEGKMLSLSSLRGKYVLVDFWASWCGPCRAENPNVVKAYNAYKNKNFTILGVSLDKNKAYWLEAIKTDNLGWNHISDLKQWSSDAVGKYAIDGIPYNVLVDPQGKIIAEGLRGEDLENKLAEVLK